MSMTTQEILQQTYNLLTDKSRWTRLAHARDKEGYVTDAVSPNAVKWCVSGALDHVARPHCTSIAAIEDTLERLDHFALVIYGTTVIEVNDLLGYTEVMNLLTTAIEGERDAM